MNRLKYIFLLCFLSSIWQGYAQQLPIVSQYDINKFFYNPAFAGSEGYTSFDFIARQQWLGFQQAPSLQLFSFQTRLKSENNAVKSISSFESDDNNSRNGVGGFIYNDNNGLIGRAGICLTYAYHVSLAYSRLSFGLSGNIFQYKVNHDEFYYFDDNDQTLLSQDFRTIIPDVNIGVFYKRDDFYAGLSSNNIMNSSVKIKLKEKLDHELLNRHYFFLTGYFFDISPLVYNESSLLVRSNKNFNFVYELSSRFIYNNNYWGGLSFRFGNYNKALVAKMGLKFERYMVAYSFDYEMGEIRRHAYGSHEIMLIYRIGDDSKRYMVWE